MSKCVHRITDDSASATSLHKPYKQFNDAEQETAKKQAVHTP